MIEIPILFSQPMVEAILDRRKTQTRRLIKPQPQMQVMSGKSFDAFKDFTGNDNPVGYTYKGCRYNPWPKCFIDIFAPWKVGYSLWVKETFYAYGWWITEGKRWRFIDFTDTEEDGKYRYFDNPPENIIPKRVKQTMGWYKRPSLFMPRAASRLLLEVKNVGVEKLHDITQEDAIKEGIKSFRPIPGDGPAETQYYHYIKDKWGPSPIHSFQTLWQKINGIESWDENPFVFKISFDKKVNQ